MLTTDCTEGHLLDAIQAIPAFAPAFKLCYSSSNIATPVCLIATDAVLSRMVTLGQASVTKSPAGLFPEGAYSFCQM